MGTVMAQREIKPCQKEPAFIQQYGLRPIMVCLEYFRKTQNGIGFGRLIKTGTESKPTANSFRGRIFQDSSWKKSGLAFLGSV